MTVFEHLFKQIYAQYPRFSFTVLIEYSQQEIDSIMILLSDISCIPASFGSLTGVVTYVLIFASIAPVRKID